MWIILVAEWRPPRIVTGMDSFTLNNHRLSKPFQKGWMFFCQLIPNLTDFGGKKQKWAVIGSHKTESIETPCDRIQNLRTSFMFGVGGINNRNPYLHCDAMGFELAAGSTGKQKWCVSDHEPMQLSCKILLSSVLLLSQHGNWIVSISYFCFPDIWVGQHI